MVDFQLTEEQLALQRLAREFAEKEIKPVAAELDAKPNPADCFSWDLVRKLSRLGFRTL
ncbi:MAG: acyl-CoA dehydrogenase family protein, partial [Nitrospinota bacterium]